MQNCLSELEFWELLEFVALHRFCCFIFAQVFIDNHGFVLGFLHFCWVFVQKLDFCTMIRLLIDFHDVLCVNAHET